MSNVGVKETKELLIGILALTSLILERTKDGWGNDDVLAISVKLLSDTHFKKKMTDAFDGMDKVSGELRDLSKEEIIELAMFLVPEVLDIIGKMPDGFKTKLDGVMTKMIPEVQKMMLV